MSPAAAADPGLERLVAALRARDLAGATVACVLGSGLGAFAERLEGACHVPFAELEGMPRSTVPGHAGAFSRGELAGVGVLVQAGRVHLYEGLDAEEVTRSVRAFARLGVRALLLTNAAGGLHAEWPAGTLMRVRDHVNMQGRTPLARVEGGHGSPYDAELGSALDEAARACQLPLEHGIYAGLPGPSYETPAEIRLLRRIGADAVGMSTVLEALAAHAAGLRVAALSLITNSAAGLAPGPLAHEEVVAAGAAAAEKLCRLLEAAVPRIAAKVRPADLEW